jgi:hypothetical protein
VVVLDEGVQLDLSSSYVASLARALQATTGSVVEKVVSVSRMVEMGPSGPV